MESASNVYAPQDSVHGSGCRVLVVTWGNMNVSGVLAYLRGVLPILVRDAKAEVTLFVPGKPMNPGMRDDFENADVRVIFGGLSRVKGLAYRMQLREKLDELMSQTHFDVIHINTANRVLTLHSLLAAKKHGIPVRVTHSHSANFTHPLPVRIVGVLYRWAINALATDYLACSGKAGIFLYGNRTWTRCGKLARNGIDTQVYAYSEVIRNEARRELLNGHAQDSLVLGFVGRMEAEKNPLFAIETFAEINSLHQESILWIVADGSMRKEAEARVKSLGIEDSVLFLGRRNDVPRLLQGMDVFLMPSLFEGLPMSLLEAQAAGLPCFVSDRVSSEAHVHGCPMEYLPLESGPRAWADSILSADLSRNIDGAKLVAESGYDVASGIDVLREYYTNA